MLLIVLDMPLAASSAVFDVSGRVSSKRTSAKLILTDQSVPTWNQIDEANQARAMSAVYGQDMAERVLEPASPGVVAPPRCPSSLSSDHLTPGPCSLGRRGGHFTRDAALSA